MRTIQVEVEDSIYRALEVISRYSRESVPQIVRKHLAQLAEPEATPATNSATAPAQAAPPNPKDKSLRDYVRSPSYVANRSVVDQWLCIFSFLYKQNPDKFQILESMEGRRRKYVGTSKEHLESSGLSVNPKRIPGTNFWIVTNNSTDNKKLLLRQALTLLGYEPETVRIIPESLR